MKIKALNKQKQESSRKKKFKFFSALSNFIELYRAWPILRFYCPMIKVSNLSPLAEQFTVVDLDSCKISVPNYNENLKIVLKFNEDFSEVLSSQIRVFLDSKNITLSPVLNLEKEEGLDLTQLRLSHLKTSVTSTIYSTKNCWKCFLTWDLLSILLITLRKNKIDYSLVGTYISDDNYPTEVTITSVNQERLISIGIGQWKPDFSNLELLKQFELK